jgi:hypothetical protein
MTRLLGKGQRPIGTMTIMAHTSSVYATLIAPQTLRSSQKNKCGPRTFARLLLERPLARPRQAITRLVLLRETKILRGVGIVGS